MIKLLIEHGADPHAQVAAGLNMFHIAAQGDEPCALEFFIRQGISINSQDGHKNTALHWAASRNSEFAIQYLIAQGANLESKDSQGRTPLHLAVIGALNDEPDKIKVIKRLLRNGANINATDS